MATVTQQERTNILKLVAGMFNAAPGKQYLDEFTNAFVAHGRDYSALAADMAKTGAFQDVYPSFLTADEFANQFLGTLNLQANAEAQAFVKDKVNAGESFAAVIFQALEALVDSTSAEFADARAILDNKAAVAEYYSVTKGYSSDELAALQKVIANVTADPKSVEAAEKAIVDPVAPGQVFTLTTAAGEKVVGTPGNDEIRGVVNAAESTSTLNIGDTIDGGAGTDTLTLTIAAATGTGSAAPAGIEIKNVEIVNLNVTSSEAAGDYLKSSLYAGVQQLWQVNTGGQVSFGSGAAGSGTVASNYNDVTVGDGVTAGFRGNGRSDNAAAAVVDLVSMSVGAASSFTYSGDVGNGSVSATGDAVKVNAASATQKVVSIALDGVGTGSKLDVVAAAGGKIETVNVSGSLAKASSSADGSLYIDLDGVNTKKFDGDFTSGVKLTLDSVTAVETVDLAGSTGGVELDVSSYAKLATLNGGSGNDKFTLNLVDVALTVDLGAGNDVLTIDDTATEAGTKGGNVTLGAGKDTVKIVDLQNITDVTDLSKGLVTVSDFVLGDDTIQLKTSGTAIGKTLTSAQLDSAKGAASLSAAIGTLFSGDNKVGAESAVVFSWGEDAYLFVNGGADATKLDAGDGLIKLTGLDASLLSTDQGGGLLFI